MEGRSRWLKRFENIYVGAFRKPPGFTGAEEDDLYGYLCEKYGALGFVNRDAYKFRLSVIRDRYKDDAMFANGFDFIIPGRDMAHGKAEIDERFGRTVELLERLSDELDAGLVRIWEEE